MTKTRYDILTSRESNGKTYYTRVGTMWPLEKGGFSLSFDALPIPTLRDGKLEVRAVALEAKPKDDAGKTGGGGKRDELDDEIPF